MILHDGTERLLQRHHTFIVYTFKIVSIILVSVFTYSYTLESWIPPKHLWICNIDINMFLNGAFPNSHDIQQCLTAMATSKVFPFGGCVGCRDQCEHRNVSSFGDSVSTVVTAAAKREEGGAMLKGKASPYFLWTYVVGNYSDISDIIEI